MMNLYITFNNEYSGIIKSQVIDRLEFVEASFGIRYKMLCFVPFKSFRIQRQEWNAVSPNAIVLPMVGGLRFWWLSICIAIPYAILYRPQIIVGRAAYATAIARSLRSLLLGQKIVFDGRGAERAEWEEFYTRNDGGHPISRIRRLERRAITRSDRLLGVSNALVEYWKKEYDLIGIPPVEVIPCTLNSTFSSLELSDILITEKRRKFNYSDQDVVLLYSGSSAEWQSLDSFMPIILAWMRENLNLKLIMLSKYELSSEDVTEFGNRISIDWVRPEQVIEYYVVADYGLLLRSDSVTNSVASPVKFAEYLAAGLQVIITEGIGDYSSIIKETDLGMIFDRIKKGKKLLRPSLEDKIRARDYSFTNLSQESRNESIRVTFV
jgi:hypothetical protein